MLVKGVKYMRIFRGNCGQAVIFEGMLRATGKVIKAEGGDAEPIFSTEKNHPSTVFYRTLLVRVVHDEKNVPAPLRPLAGNLYRCTIRYDLTNNKGYIRMTREVVDYLCRLVPDAERILAAMDQAEENGKNNVETNHATNPHTAGNRNT